MCYPSCVHSNLLVHLIKLRVSSELTLNQMSRLLRLWRLLLLLLLPPRAASQNLYLENLPDGVHDVLVSHHGGLYITGFDSRRRVCLGTPAGIEPTAALLLSPCSALWLVLTPWVRSAHAQCSSRRRSAAHCAR